MERFGEIEKGYGFKHSSKLPVHGGEANILFNEKENKYQAVYRANGQAFSGVPRASEGEAMQNLELLIHNLTMMKLVLPDEAGNIHGVIDVELPPKIESYKIVIESDIFPRIADFAVKNRLANRYIITTDTNVQKYHAAELERALSAKRLRFDTIAILPGEKSKTRETCEYIMNGMFELGCGKDTAIIALGGGVVGDLSGLAANEFVRGIPIVQVPTSLVAQCDSSVGGKVAINNKYGKNLIGSLKNPAGVFADYTLLWTLPESEYINGLAEVIRSAVIDDANLFRFIEDNKNLVVAATCPSSVSQRLVTACCDIKARLVERDFEENGERRILNFGHTFGHAYELLSDYHIPHGQAVARGMVGEAKIAVNEGYLSKEDFDRLAAQIKTCFLPTEVPDGMTNKDIREAIKTDKKSVEGRPRFALPIGIGRMHDFNGAYATFIDDDVVDRALDECREKEEVKREELKTPE